jgi:L-serine dehydratase
LFLFPSSTSETARDETIAYAGLFELFKIGLGPSSSHTTGPMLIAKSFAENAALLANDSCRIKVRLMGSLAWTGVGHRTPEATILGLLGLTPDRLTPEVAVAEITRVTQQARLVLNGTQVLTFVAADDIVFDKLQTILPHPNTMVLRLINEKQETLLEETWLSLGGGFIRRSGENAKQGVTRSASFSSGTDLIALCDQSNSTISDVVLKLECKDRGHVAVQERIEKIVGSMLDCIARGLSSEGPLPDALGVSRRAKSLLGKFTASNAQSSEFERISGLISTYAIAVNEENAAGHVIVTAPTNGAAGVIPAVLRYLRDHCVRKGENPETVFILTATAIGSLLKRNASISGAEVGCQGEVGSASAMAAAGLTAACGGTPRQVCHAAEIALEHHLGMTCDPIGGLVQIPCIERNAFGALKAINASNLALAENGVHRVSLDQVIATMFQTGKDMRSEYRETSRGGLAVHVPIC